ncbi:MAG TPA: hypothetical protein VN284_03790 [Rhizobium sp.]|uniref:hypothetical protein n=1 Tax=Rhizobium sp. F40D2 TaxID=3453141 RepID=UPI002C6D7F5A|nr:hypothetical protein [Rhizobium sp.]
MHDLKSWHVAEDGSKGSKTLKRRQENRAEKRMDAPICQGLARAARLFGTRLWRGNGPDAAAVWLRFPY